jgi:hypothetical protein
VCPSVRPSNILLTRRLSEVWLDGRVEGRWGLSLTHKHKWGGEFSLTHTHTQIKRWVLTHSHTEIGRWAHTHTLKLGGDFSLTYSNEKVSSQSLTHPRSITCVNGFTHSFLNKKIEKKIQIISNITKSLLKKTHTHTQTEWTLLKKKKWGPKWTCTTTCLVERV